MRVTFLGTSAAWAIPRPGCDCPQCRSSDPRERRSRSSLLVDGHLLIDCGPDFSHQWEIEGFPSIDHLLLTHAHHDHILGLRELTPDYTLSETVVHGLEATLERVGQVHGDLPLHTRSCSYGRTFMLGDLPVTPLPVEHSERTPTAGFRVGNLFYAPDCAALPDDTIESIRGIDTLILDGSYPERGDDHHLSIVEAEEIAGRCGARRAYFTHIGHSGLTLRQLQSRIDHRSSHHVAWDGLTITVGA